jgi:hypothetical protein
MILPPLRTFSESSDHDEAVAIGGPDSAAALRESNIAVATIVAQHKAAAREVQAFLPDGG